MPARTKRGEPTKCRAGVPTELLFPVRFGTRRRCGIGLSCKRVKLEVHKRADAFNERDERSHECVARLISLCTFARFPVVLTFNCFLITIFLEFLAFYVVLLCCPVVRTSVPVF